MMEWKKSFLALAVAAAATGMTACGGGGGGGSTDTPTDDGGDNNASAQCPVGNLANSTKTVFGKAFPVCELGSDIMSDATLTNDYVYVLTDTVNVGDGGAQGATANSVKNVTLTIEAGSQIFAEQGANALVVTRGSDIVVNGTADQPVVMSSMDDGYDGGGEWGGLIIDGFGVVNKGAEVGSEAAPDGVSRYFGGNNNGDDSGEIHYLIIAESGYEFRTDEEVQGLTLEGVGAGTEIDHVQIVRSEDDGVEFFGGAVNVKYLVVNGQDDDAIDMDLGYNGSIQYALVKMGANNGDRGIESDNNGDNYDAAPRTMPTLANVTILGNVGKADKDTRAALHREGMAGTFAKVLYTDTDASTAFEKGCLDVDDTKTQVNSGALSYQNALFNCMAGVNVGDDDDGAGNEYAQGITSSGGVMTTSAYPNSTTWAGPAAAKLGAATTVDDTEPTDFIGAVDPDAAVAWWDGWTLHIQGADGTLKDVDFHPLEAEIGNGTITPAL